TNDPAMVISVIADALRINVRDADDLNRRVARALGQRDMVLVLDNFEQVIAAGLQLTSILAQCPNITMLVTSRTPLHVRGEYELPLAPLATPEPDETDLATLEQNAAVSLFVERARSVQPEFALTTQNALDIVEICRRLDGLSLAIELAAARTKVFPVSALRHR